MNTTEWIPINDPQKPLDESIVWVTLYNNGDRFVGLAKFTDGRFTDDEYRSEVTSVLAWMPYIIPPPFAGQIP